ncbi:MAG: TetR/AcrR family transcriptional regulator [Actinomycetia bacterium]|nr:TetR/AcrR family transcriptional regulator [Actinomycetes bacterium]
MKQEIRSKTTRENIIATASQCFSKIGYGRTDVGEICRRADLSKGAFYYHFSSKQDLFLEILDQWIKKVAGKMDHIGMTSPEILEVIIGIPDNFSPLFEEIGNQLPIFLEIYVKALSDPDLKKIVLKSYKKFIVFFTGILKKGIEDGHIRRMDPLEGAEMLFSMTIGTIMQGLLRPGSRDWADLSKKNIRLLLAPQ